MVGAGEPVFVHGLVLDDVVGVDVVDDGHAVHRARLGNNAFFFQHERPDSWTTGVVLTYEGGSKRTISLPGGPPPGLG